MSFMNVFLVEVAADMEVQSLNICKDGFTSWVETDVLHDQPRTRIANRPLSN